MADDFKEFESDGSKVVKAGELKVGDDKLIGHYAEPTILKDTTKIDVDLDHAFTDHMIMAGLSNKIDMEEINKFTAVSDSREVIYSQIDTMFQDSTVSSVGRTYAEDVCEVADNGHIVWAESADPKISKHINYLLNVAGIDKKVYGWAYSLVKYGDIYIKLYRESDYEDNLFKRSTLDTIRQHSRLHESNDTNLDESVRLSLHRETDPYSYYVEMVPDPSTMFEVTKRGITCGFMEVPNEHYTLTNNEAFGAATGLGATSTTSTVGQYNFNMKTDDVIIHQADDYVHAYLDDENSRFPETVDIFIPDDENADTGHSQSYTVRRGKSLFYDAYKIWREKQLLEAAALLARLTKSSVIRKVGVEVGNTSREKSAQILRSVKEMFEQKTAYNTGKSMAEYTNPGAVENFIFHVIRNNVGSINVETIGGDFDPKQLTDLDWWNNKFYSSFGIPKQYFGWTDDGAGFNGGSALTVISSVYAKGVKRVQNALAQAINTMIDLFLAKSGLISYINNYTIKFKAPLTNEEISGRENLSNRTNAISSLNSLFNDVETKSIRLEILRDLVNTLNYGDDLSAHITEEIKIAKQAEEKAKADAEAAEAAEAEGGVAADNGGGELDLDLGGGGDDNAGGGDLNLDLDNIPAAPDTPQESFKPGDGLASLQEDVEFLDESTDLPNPDDIEGGEIDFSKSN